MEVLEPCQLLLLRSAKPLKEWLAADSETGFSRQSLAALAPVFGYPPSTD